jgi:ubiquinone/menaquinone biosynthesis C-methylase UbiE
MGSSEREKNRGWSAEEYGVLAGFAGDWRDSWWNRDFLELMARRWRLDEVSSALDVGCGAGHWGLRLAALLPPQSRITCVDHEAGFFDAARARAKARGLDADFVVGSAVSLPFEDASFDLVTCQTVLIHVGDAKRAILEMTRVLKPGGILIASEPNNLVNSLAEATAEPEPPFEETLRVLRFQKLLHRGKIALGQGDTSIGEKLPGYFAELGLGDIAVYSNDRCPALYPPYSRPEQRADLAQMLAWIDADISGWGDKEAVRALYLAGGGDPAEYEELWQIELSRARAFKADIEAGRWHAARGHLQYLVSGRKPR